MKPSRTKKEQPADLLPATVEEAFVATTPEEEEAIESGAIEARIVKECPSELVKTLQRLSYYLASVGLEFEEACRMVRYDPVKMRENIKLYPVIEDLIQIKELRYKTDLIKTISKKAISGGDDKLAQWLLERRFPGEFNPKKGTGGSGGGADIDLLGMAIEFIQKSGDSTPLVRETSGRAFLFKKNSGEQIRTVDARIHDALA